jgi:hypothetical protein
VRNIELPPHPHQGIALLHQEAVAEIPLGGWVGYHRCAVVVAKDVLAPAVEDIEERDAVAAGGIFRSKHVEISRKRHAPVRIARRLVEIDDGLIAGMRGIDREKHLPDDLLVGAGGAERLAAENVRARSNLDSRHLRLHAMTRAGDRGDDQRTSEPQ